jgi:uncharacterized protein YjbI with pentapeptide repeats
MVNRINVNFGKHQDKEVIGFIEEMYIYISNKNKDNSLIVDGMHITKLSLSGYISTKDILFKDMLIGKELCLENVNCSEKIKFHSISLDGVKFKVSNSDLGKTEFINVNFNELAEFRIIDSKLSDMVFTKCDMSGNIIPFMVKDCTFLFALPTALQYGIRC